MAQEGPPFGAVDINVEGCTLCLSCVSACPTGALSDSEEKPALYFSESACVQCGLCAATCPEKVIALKPQVDFEAWSAPRRALKEEEPFHCIRCARPFGTRSTIERIVAKLEGRHWMYAGANAQRRNHHPEYGNRERNLKRAVRDETGHVPDCLINVLYFSCASSPGAGARYSSECFTIRPDA